MTRSPLVSILVPLYNKVDWVASTIQSAIDQIYSNTEIVVIDDGSTDGSADRVAAITDPRIRLVSRPNRGANATRNELLELARGEFVQYLDADDLLDPTKLELQVAGLLSGADVSLSAVRIQREVAGPPSAEIVNADGLFKSLVARGFLTIAPLHRRASLVEVGGWDDQLPASQEFDLHLRLFVGGHWENQQHLDLPLASWRNVPNSTSADERRLYESKLVVLRRIANSVDGDNVFHLAKAIVNAGRHLARERQFSQAHDALTFANSLDPRSIEEFPLRLRRVPTLELRLRAEWIDARIRNAIGQGR